MAEFVFVSYSRKDNEYVEGLVAYLAEQGIATWIDLEQIGSGDRWAHLIESKITACSAVVVVMSPASASSEWVEREINLARARNRPILPLLLAGETFFVLNNLHFDDVSDGRIPPPTFVEELRRLTGATQPPLTPPGPAATHGGGEALARPKLLTGPRRTAGRLPKAIRIRTQLAGAVRSVSTAISPDETWLATAGADGKVRVWDVDGTLLATLPQHDGPVVQVAIARDASWLMSVTANRLQWWDAASASAISQPLRTEALGSPTQAAFPTVAEQPASGGLFRRRRFRDGKPSPQAEQPYGGYSSVPLVEPPVYGGYEPAPAYPPSVYGGYEPAPAYPPPAYEGYQPTLTSPPPGYGAYPEPYTRSLMALSSGGRWLAAKDGGVVRKLDASPSAGRLPGSDTSVVGRKRQDGRPLAVSPDDRIVTVACDDGTVWLARLDGGPGVDQVLAGSYPGLPASGNAGMGVVANAAAWSPDGRWLLTARGSGAPTSYYHPISIWNPDNGTCLGNLGSPAQDAYALAVAPGGEWFAAGTSQGAFFWRVATATPLPAVMSDEAVYHISLGKDATWCVFTTPQRVLVCDIAFT